MVKNFTHKGLALFYYDGVKKGIQPKHAERLADTLDRLDAAVRVEDMNFPGSGFHPLLGKMRGFWSVKISGNWRLVFRFEGGDAYDVNYIDYH